MGRTRQAIAHRVDSAQEWPVKVQTRVQAGPDQKEGVASFEDFFEAKRGRLFRTPAPD